MHILRLATLFAICTRNLVSALEVTRHTSHLGESFSRREDDNPLRIMIVGDSITHGGEGDHTWRYRLWEWMKSEDILKKVDFVGPYTGVVAMKDNSPSVPPPVIGETTDAEAFPRIKWGYAKDVPLDFDADHYATNGWRALQMSTDIQATLEQYPADVLLTLVGVNDIIWGQEEADTVLASMKRAVENARKSNPNIKILLGNVVHFKKVWGDMPRRITEYDAMLLDAIPNWSTAQSPIYHVDVEGAYTCSETACNSTQDGLHPNELGAYEIAQVFSSAIIEHLSLGQKPLEIPAVLPEFHFSAPTNFVAHSTGMGVQVTWDHIFGAVSYNFRTRGKGNETWSEHFVPWHQTTVVFGEDPIADGQELEFQVAGCNGDYCGEWTEIISAQGYRHTAPAPSNIRVSSTKRGFRMQWAPPLNTSDWNIDMYEVKFQDMSSLSVPIKLGSREFEQEFTGWGGYPVGTVLTLSMATWTPEGRGLYDSDLPPVCTGGLEPETPGWLRGTYINSNLIALSWNASANTGAYVITTRDLSKPWSPRVRYGKPLPVTYASKTEGIVGPLPPGRGRYEICLTAISGDAKSQPICITPARSWLDYDAALRKALGLIERHSFAAVSFIWLVGIVVLVIIVLLVRKHSERRVRLADGSREPAIALDGRSA